MPKKKPPKIEDEEEIEVEEDDKEIDDELDEAGFHLTDGDDVLEAEPKKKVEIKGEEDYESGSRKRPKKKKPAGSKLIDDFEDHIEDEDEEEDEEDEEADDEEIEDEDEDYEDDDDGEDEDE